MSSSEGENFNMDVSGSESEDYAPAPKKKPAPKPKSTAKAAPKKTAKKPVLVDKDDNASDPEDEGPGSEAGPSEPATAANRKKKTASETYQKLTQLEHILKRPDSYIGSVEKITQPMWVWDTENKRLVLKEITYVPGFFKIVDEILVNAADNKINDSSMDTVKVTIDPENNTISVYNNGRGIPIEMHSRENIFIPELIFGHLLSSSNYDDEEKKLTGGRNGYGAKLANIYSLEFTVDTADKNSGQKYVQTWTNNMGKMGKAKITKNSKKEEYTRVTFKPDLKRFGMDSIDEDAVALLKKRVYDLAGTVRDVKVVLNDERLKIKNFKQYVELYLSSAAEQASDESGGAAQVKQAMIYEQVGKRWEVAFAVSDGTFQHISFANHIATTKGGTHVQLISDQIAKNLITFIQKKNKAATVKPAQIKNQMWIFVNALIENPTFDSQTKETMTLPASKFGTKPTLSEEFLKKAQKSSIIDQVLNWAQRKADKDLKKTDGNRRNRLTGLPKLSDANNAGTKKSADCTLILTEGDSAKSLAIAGLSVVGRDNYGVFPLRGKLLNVRDAKHDQIMKNEEIQALKKILGLQHNKDYKDVSSLRYGRIMIMTDQDHDGSHIKGLIINFFDFFYPGLVQIAGFVVEFVTPIVRITKGASRVEFFTLPQYEQWKEETPDSYKWVPKYFKGLGTSNDEDARRYFSKMDKHMIPFAAIKEEERPLLELAFSKKKADDRKEWLRQLKPGTYLDHDTDIIELEEFINKELILFSQADNIRSIPSAADGLKPGQRKVIWSCFRRKLKSEIKVAQLVGYIAEKSAYHHGEQSLMMTIINMAQDFVGSNNINLLMPNGQFGTRDQGGKDHAAARYIFTELSPMTRAVFHPADDPLLQYMNDDGNAVEPEWYMPIVPMVLINGAEGIGTGWSTNVPSYNPLDIVANIRRLMRGEELEPMMPWWRGFKGTIKKLDSQKYEVTGIINKLDDATVEITELPIHKWTQNYKQELEAMCGEKGDGPVKDYKEHHANTNVHFVINMSDEGMKKAEAQGLVEFFKLTTKVNTSNMICFDFDGLIKRYGTPEEIIEDFYPKRLAYYQKRKDFLANELLEQLEKLKNQARFIQMIVNKELVISGRKKADIVIELRKKGFKSFSSLKKARSAGENEDVVEDEEEDEATAAVSNDFDYLLNMSISSLTTEKIEKLKQQGRDKDAELLALLELTPIQIWNTDLDKFMQEWDQMYLNWENKSIQGATVKRGKGKGKQATLAAAIRKKVKKEEDDDADDDFKPTKTAASKPKKVADAKPVKKPTAAVPSGSKVELVKDEDEDIKPPPAKRKPPVKKAIPKDESDDDDFSVAPPKKPAKKAITKDESDDDDDSAPLPPPKKQGKKPSSKPSSKDDSDSDIEMIDNPPAPAAKKNAATKDDDSDSDFEMIAPAKGKGKEKEKANAPPKRKSPDSEDEDSDVAYLKPVKKKSVTDKPQASVTDFFDKVPSGATAAKKPAQTARKPSSSSQTAATKAKAAPARKKKVVESDDDDLSIVVDDDPPPVAKRNEAPKRAARTAAKKYIEIPSTDEGEDGSEFEDFD